MTGICWAMLLAVCAWAQAEQPSVDRIDDHVFRGKQPKKDDFSKLAQMGIRTVLDLRGGSVHAPRERKEVEAAGMQYISVRLSGVFAPRDQQIEEILAVLQDQRRAPVFIHCKRGDDRSGVAIACYRMVHDHWTNAQALQEANAQGFSHLEILMRRYVRHFDPARLSNTNQVYQGSAVLPASNKER